MENCNIKVLYITAETPWGKGEPFVLVEMIAMSRLGVDLRVIPRNPPKKTFYIESEEIVGSAVWLPLIDFKIASYFLKALVTSFSLWKILMCIIRHSRNPWILIKNLAVLPKGVFVAEMLRGENNGHIHAHWGSTTSTMAYVVSALTGIPWSFTLHRWDIKEDNMLGEKLKTAQFVRCISMHGENELEHIVGNRWKNKTHVIHMGVAVPEAITESKTKSDLFTMVVPANLVEVKGHKYLIDALSLLVNSSTRNFRCIFYGEGPLRTELRSLIKKRGLGSHIEMPGIIAHEELLEMYRDRKIDLVVLPSINTRGGEHEGIPIALMEAMSFGIPAMSTYTGAIPELLHNDAGVMCQEKEPRALADAISYIIENPDFVQELRIKGHNRIKDEFNVKKIVTQLITLMRN